MLLNLEIELLKNPLWCDVPEVQIHMVQIKYKKQGIAESTAQSQE